MQAVLTGSLIPGLGRPGFLTPLLTLRFYQAAFAKAVISNTQIDCYCGIGASFTNIQNYFKQLQCVYLGQQRNKDLRRLLKSLLRCYMGMAPDSTGGFSAFINLFPEHRNSICWTERIGRSR